MTGKSTIIPGSRERSTPYPVCRSPWVVERVADFRFDDGLGLLVARFEMLCLTCETRRPELEDAPPAGSEA